MSLAKGDHLVIKRNGKLMEDEAYHEFEVMSNVVHENPDPNDKDERVIIRNVELRVVE